MDFLLWIDSLLYAEDTFKAEKDNASLKKSITNILVASLIYAIISALIITKKIFSLLVFPLLLIILFFLISLIFYFFARVIFKGHGSRDDFAIQTYFLSLIISPIILFSLIIQIIPYYYIGLILFFIILIYSFPSIVVSIKESHNFRSKKKANLSCLYSIFSLSILFFILGIISWQFGMLGHSFGMENKAIGFQNFFIPNSEILYNKSKLEFKIFNSFNEPIIITKLIPLDDCNEGVVDLDKNTEKREIFVIIEPKQFKDVKIKNCKSKIFMKRFNVPVRIEYTDKILGEKINRLDSGIIQGVSEDELLPF